MANDKNPVITPSILKIDEVVDDMTQALANLAKVNNQTKMMVEIIEKSDKAEQFKEFIEGSKKEAESKQAEYEELLSHRNLLASLKERYIALFKEDEEKATLFESAIHDVFVAFNLLKEEQANA